MMSEELPIGAALDWKPVAAPARAPLHGHTVRLEPVDAARHADDLFDLSTGAPRLWTYLGYGPFPDRAAFRHWLEARAGEEDPLFFAAIDGASGRASGMASYMRMSPAMGVIEIGHIWFAPALQKTRQATEAIFLLMRHVFDDLGYRRLEWKCDALNAASRRAAARFGFTYEGIFRQHMVYKGRNRDTAWFAMLDTEWPAIRAGFEDWLDPGNFDAGGAQRAPLTARGGGANQR
jgi:RimJ/RimL family protein N-acetyltransferase